MQELFSNVISTQISFHPVKDLWGELLKVLGVGADFSPGLLWENGRLEFSEEPESFGDLLP